MHSCQQGFPLPPDLLARVLQRLSQPDILRSCSLVSRGWRAAAASAAAARGIEVQLTGSRQGQPTYSSRVERAGRWLARYGRQLTRLRWETASHKEPLTVCLPYSQLCQLQALHLVRTQLVQPKPAPSPRRSSSNNSSSGSGSSSSSGSSSGSSKTGAAGQTTCSCGPTCPLTALTSLTSLELASSGIGSGIMCLSALRALQQLALQDASAADFSAALPGLAQLAQLTSIRLQSVKGTVGAPLQLSSLVHLQELCVKYSPVFTYSQLPGSLTSLAVIFDEDDESYGELAFSSSSTPGIANWTALQKLDLEGVREVDPAVLAGMTRLVSIELLIAQFSVQELAALLAMLPRLQQLEYLSVEGCGIAEHVQLPAAVAFKQLPTDCCLPHLTRLLFSNVSWPAEVGQHIFGAGWRLPALRHLGSTYGTSLSGDSLLDWFPEAAAAPLGAGDLARLASCCPALEGLDIYGALQPGAYLSSLASLKSLSCLSVAGEAIDDASGRELAQLTQLQHLSIRDAPEFTDAGVLCLTRLTGLRHLFISDADVSAELDPDDDLWGLYTRQDSPPDVWQQLERMCRGSSVCRELMLLEVWDKQLAEQAAGSMQQQHALQQQLAALQQQNSLLQQQIAVQQQHIASLQQQNALLQQQGHEAVQQRQHMEWLNQQNALLQQRVAALEQGCAAS